MADNNGAGVGTGLIAGILLVALLAVGLIYFNGGFNLKGGKDVNVNIEAPKSGGDGK
jgi:ABC-type transporter Mla subunit MlaD